MAESNEENVRKLYEDVENDTRDNFAAKRLAEFNLHFGNVWLEYFTNATNPDSLNRGMIRALRILIAEQTLRFAKKGRYTTVKTSTTVEFDEDLIRKSIDQGKYHRSPDELTQIEPKFQQTTVSVVDGDCLEVAKQFLDEGMNPLVLNMANPRTPGGGWRSGAGAQEENIFRRSLYHLCLGRGDVKYPIDIADAVYNPNVIVFRSSEAKGYELLQQPYVMSFIACPALIRPSCDRNPSKGGELWMQDKEAKKMENKIRSIYRVGALQEHDCLILSAFGCGAFKCPPKHVAHLFRKVLEEDEFNGIFRHIAFAIFDDHNARKSHNPEGNVKPFQDIFGKDYRR